MILYYNTNIAPVQRFDNINVLTRLILMRIFREGQNSTLFRSTHHFLSTTRFFTNNKITNTTAIICAKSKIKNDSKYDENTVQIRRNQHFLFPASMLYSLLELKSIWCNECDEQLFQCYKRSECPKCNA